MPLATVAVPGYQILDHLGSGASGEVFRAQSSDGSTRAIKFLSSGGFSKLERLRFLREFEILTQIDHPHILRVYEFHDQVPCFCMELVSGLTLEAWMGQHDAAKRSSSPVFDEMLRHTAQILGALAALHGAGIVHRDLKPANLMVTNEQGVKIMDFGLAHVTANERLTASGAILGTPLYLAPELLTGNAPDPRSDLYSLGMVLYEAWGGELPRPERGLMAFLQSLLNWTPRPLEECNPVLPSMVGNFVARLMAKDLSDRFPSAHEASQELQSLLQGPRTQEPQRARCRPQFLESALVGRKAEVDRAHSLVGGLRLGQGFLLVISGEPGIGKSRLLEEIRRKCLEKGVRVFVVACLEGDPTPYAPYLPLMRQALDGLTRRQVNLVDTLGPSVGLLARVLPELEGQLPPPPQLDAQAERARFYELAVRLLETLRHDPCLFCFDDMQWADAASLDLFRYISGRLRLEQTDALAAQATVILHRTDEVPEGHPLHALITLLARSQPLERIVLDFLTPDQVAVMSLSIVGGDTVCPELTEHLHQASGGNPLYVAELLRGLLQESRIALEAGHWTFVTGAGTAFEAAQSMTALVERRLEKLGEPARDLLAAAGVLGKKFRFSVLSSMFPDVDESELFRSLEELLKARLLIERASDGRDVLAFYHDRFREILLSRISGPRYQKLHRRAAEAYQRCSVGDASQPDLLARHYLEGGDLENARAHLHVAALQAKRSYAARKALSYYQQLRDLGDSSAEVRESLADLHYMLGDAQKATELYTELLPQHLEREKRCSLQHRLGRSLRSQGRHREALDAYFEALLTLGVKIPRNWFSLRLSLLRRMPVVLRAMLVPPKMELLKPDEGPDLLEESFDLITSNGLLWTGFPLSDLFIQDVFARQYSHAMSTHRLSQVARVQGVGANGLIWQWWRFAPTLKAARRLCEHCLTIAERVKDPIVKARIYRDVGWGYLQLSEVPDSVRYLEAAASLCQSVEDFYGGMEAFLFLSTARYCQGLMAQCAQEGNQAAHLASLGADPYFEAMGMAIGAVGKACQGRAAEVDREMAQAEAVAVAQNDPMLQYVTDDAVGRAMAWRNRWEEARARFHRGSKAAPGPFFQSDIIFREAECLGRLGDLGGMQRILRDWRSRVQHMPRQKACWSVHQAWLWQQQGQLEPAQRILEEAVSLASSSGALALHARCTAALGMLRKDEGQVESGRQQLLHCQDFSALHLLGLAHQADG